MQSTSCRQSPVTATTSTAWQNNGLAMRKTTRRDKKHARDDTSLPNRVNGSERDLCGLRKLLERASGHARRRRPLFSDHKKGTGSIEIGKQLRKHSESTQKVTTVTICLKTVQSSAAPGAKLEFAGIWLGVELQHWQASSSWDVGGRTGRGGCLH